MPWRICKEADARRRRPLRSAGQISDDDEARRSDRNAAQATVPKRSTTPATAWLSRTPTLVPPASLVISTHCPLLMLYELFRQPPLSPTGVLSPIYYPFGPIVKKLQ